VQITIICDFAIIRALGIHCELDSLLWVFEKRSAKNERFWGPVGTSVN